MLIGGKDERGISGRGAAILDEIEPGYGRLQVLYSGVTADCINGSAPGFAACIAFFGAAFRRIAKILHATTHSSRG